MKVKDLSGVVEGILFLSGDPVNMKDLAKALNIERDEMEQLIPELEEVYNSTSRGLMLTVVGDCLRLTTKPEIFPYIESYFKPKVKTQLSKAALETLAVIMFKQPVTRAEIETVRCVNAEKALNGLLEKDLIREAGRMDTVGRPILYETTQLCMEHFGLRSLGDIPGEFKKCIN